MANPDVHGLVRLLAGEVDYQAYTDGELYTLAQAARRGRTTLHEVTLVLRSRGHTFAQIGARLGVSLSAASRWVDPPRPAGRPRHDSGGVA